MHRNFSNVAVLADVLWDFQLVTVDFSLVFAHHILPPHCTLDKLAATTKETNKNPGKKLDAELHCIEKGVEEIRQRWGVWNPSSRSLAHSDLIEMKEKVEGYVGYAINASGKCSFRSTSTVRPGSWLRHQNPDLGCCVHWASWRTPRKSLRSVWPSDPAKTWSASSECKKSLVTCWIPCACGISWIR